MAEPRGLVVTPTGFGGMGGEKDNLPNSYAN